MLQDYVNFYNKNGFAIIPGDLFLSKEEHNSLLQVAEKHTNDLENIDRWVFNKNGTPNKIEGACEFEPLFLEVAKKDILVKFAQSVTEIGEDVDCFISKFFPQTKGGESTLWHQDNFYFQGSPKDIVSCAIYLTDTAKENGCLRIARGTHLNSNLFPHTVDSGIPGIKWISEDVVSTFDIVDLELKGPYAVFFNINVAHGCYHNSTNYNRYSLAWEYVSSYNFDLEYDPFHQQFDRNSVT